MEKNSIIFVNKKLYLVNYLDLIWSWILNF